MNTCIPYGLYKAVHDSAVLGPKLNLRHCRTTTTTATITSSTSNIVRFASMTRRGDFRLFTPLLQSTL